jgi:hypothetical protein
MLPPLFEVAFVVVEEAPKLPELFEDIFMDPFVELLEEVVVV